VNAVQEELHQWPDRQGVEDGPDTHGSTQDESEHQDRQLNAGAHHPDAEAGALDDGDPQSIAWSVAEPCPDVERAGQAVADEAEDEQGGPRPQVIRRSDERQARIGCETNEGDIQHGSDPRTLAQRDPQQQDDGTDGDDHLSERHGQVVRQALVEDVPRVESESRLDQQRHGEAVEHEPEDELDEAGEHQRIRCGSNGSNGAPVSNPRAPRVGRARPA
jgi:hypothetical protein